MFPWKMSFLKIQQRESNNLGKNRFEMFICVECHIEMRCDKNEVGADVGEGFVYSTDRFKCPSCGKMILSIGRGQKPIYDPERQSHSEILTVRK